MFVLEVIRMRRMTNRSTVKVFLGFSYQDKELAQIIADRIKDRGMRVLNYMDADFPVVPGVPSTVAIERAISSSDYFILLLSRNSVRRKWFEQELSAALVHELTARDLIIVPVLISDIDINAIPPALRSIQWLDLRTDPEKRIDLLVEQIASASKIDFSSIDGKAFEKLIAELLKSLGFTRIQHPKRTRKWQPDLIAEFSSYDPFGVRTKENWLIEVKLYKDEKADLRSLYQLAIYALGFPERCRVLLITTSQLTSAAKKWLQDFQQEENIQVRVIEGPELKRLLLRFPNLVKRYFAESKQVSRG
jgi:hypothetical protein